MKNAIVFTVSSARWAIELRWVREVITLGHVTPVPTAPPLISGVVNFGGGIVPVVEIAAILAGAAEPRLACRGESAVLVEIEAVRAAVRLDAVLEVATLRREGELWTGAGGGPVQLVDPREMIARARSLLGGESPALGRTR